MGVRLRRRVVDFELKAAEVGGPDGKGGMWFEGYAAATRNLDGYCEIIAPGAFAQDLPKFMDDGFVGGLNHNWDKPIGSPAAASEDARGLKVRANLLPSLKHAVECHTLIKERVCKKLSIGFRTMQREYLEDPEAVLEWWKGVEYSPSEMELTQIKYGACILKRIRLFEFSPVMRPANELADITDVKSGPRGGRGFDDHLREALASVEEVCERAAQVARKRAEAGRAIPPERRAMLRRMHDLIGGALAASEPRVSAEDVRRLQADLLGLEIELDGVA